MNSSANRYKSLVERARQSYGNLPLTKAFADRKAIIGPQAFPSTDEGKLAQGTLEALEAGEDVTPKGLAALQLMVTIMRPAPCVIAGTVDSLDQQAESAFPDWKAFCAELKKWSNSVGRIDDATGQGIGTGFLVDKATVVTNKHVVALLSRKTMVLERGQATINFRKEYQVFEADTVTVLGVAAVHDSEDLALLRTDPLDTVSHQPLQFAAKVAEQGSALVAVGFPFKDARNPLFISGIYKDIYGVKRASPGRVVAVSTDEITHDCSTLGGNSGSPLLSMDDASLKAVHCEGMFMYENRAIPAQILEEFIQANA